MKAIKTISAFVIMTIAFSSFMCKSKSATSNLKTVMAENYRIVIAFISKGAGIDGKTMDAVTKFIEEHPKKPALEKYRWGREGEQDFALKLSELSTKEQKTFVEEIQKIAGKSDLVQISENAPCVHKK
jgi:hypothetical protein